VNVAPEVEEKSAVERVDRPFQQLGRRGHAVVHRLLEPVHAAGPMLRDFTPGPRTGEWRPCGRGVAMRSVRSPVRRR
jgi:hypothetical protein